MENIEKILSFNSTVLEDMSNKICAACADKSCEYIELYYYAGSNERKFKFHSSEVVNKIIPHHVAEEILKSMTKDKLMGFEITTNPGLFFQLILPQSY